MKHFFSIFSRLHHVGYLILVVGLMSTVTLVRPVLAAPVCPSGTQPVGGQCCPEGQIQINNGQLSCAPSPPNSCQSQEGQSGSNNGTSCLFSVYVNPLIQFLSAAFGVIVVIGIIYGAIEYITSGGDPAKAASGKAHVTTALIALFAYLLLYAFLQFLLPGGLLNG